MKTALKILSSTASLFLIVGCMSIPGSGYLLVNVSPKSPKLVWSRASGASTWGVCAHPFEKRISDTRVALTYWVAGDGATSGTAETPWPRYSDDGGNSWQNGDPYKWPDGAPPTNILASIAMGQQFSGFNLGIFFGDAHLPDGSRLLRARLASHPDFASHAVKVSADGQVLEDLSLTYEIPEDIFETSGMAIENPSVVMPDGTIFTVAYGRADPIGKCATWLFSLAPGETTCRFVSVVARPENAPWGNEGPCEPALVLLKDGSLLCIMRTGMATSFDYNGKSLASPMLAARSHDGGKTWKYEKMNYPGVMPKLLMMQNGVLALAFGRPGNTIAFSVDNGHTWGRELTLTPPDRGTTGYCDIVEIGKNQLLAVYDCMDYRSSDVWLWAPPPAVNALLTRVIEVNPRF